MIEPDRAAVAVLIGLVSTEDRDRILETLESLATKQGEVACEVILVDRRKDDVSREIARRYPQVRLIPCPAGTTLPEMRTMAFEASRADIVAVTEDHCVPAAYWLEQILAGLRESDVVAVGGCVDNGVYDTSYDWATFLCEYSFFYPPVAEGQSDILPGMNVAYRRSALASVPRELLTSGFWETTVHSVLRKQGGKFVSLNAMRMNHCKRFSRKLFSRQRYVYSRYYAGIRFGRGEILRRCIAAVLCMALPPLLLWRMRKATSAKRLQEPFRRALPSLCGLVIIWSFGEMVGYLAGPGRALAEIE
jgi:hypothetical protein